MDTLEAFKKYLLTHDQEESTVKTNIKLIRRVLSDCRPLSCASFSLFVDNLIIAKNAKNYIRQYVNIVRYWADYIGIEELKNYPYPKLRTRNTFIRGLLSDEEIEQFINIPYPNTLKGRFEEQWYMFSIFWRIQAWTGCRPSEVAQLTVNDVDFGTNEFHVDGKTGPRDIPIASTIYDSVKEYIDNLKTPLLFPSMQDSTKHVRQGGWEKNFNKRKAIMNIKRDNVSAYSFRHSFASRLIDESSIYRVKELMGHRKITTTEKYLHTNKERLRKTIESDPLSKKHKSGEEILMEIVKLVQIYDEKYRDKIYTNYHLSEDGKELTIMRKVRD